MGILQSLVQTQTLVMVSVDDQQGVYRVVAVLQNMFFTTGQASGFGSMPYEPLFKEQLSSALI